jgi:hypothetical protein
MSAFVVENGISWKIPTTYLFYVRLDKECEEMVRTTKSW